MVKSSNAIYNTVGATISGVRNQLTITNQSNTASSAARMQTTVGGTSAGNPTINWDVGGGTTDFEMGINNTTSILTISNGTVLGTNDSWKMNTAGQRTMPLQPAFLATLSAIRTNVTGDGTLYTIVYDGVTFDQASSFSGGTTFTAPITGKYFFTFSLNIFNLSPAHTRAFQSLPDFSATELNPANVMSSAGNCTMLSSAFIPMTAGQTLKATITVFNGTKTVSTGGAGYDNYFTGWLVC